MDDVVPSEKVSFKLRLSRETSGVMARLRKNWLKRWFRWGCYLLGAGLLFLLLLWVLVIRNLPNAATLANYQPPLPTNIRSMDGTPVHSYARERRVQLSYPEYPKLLVRAYLAAEDRTFFEHGGLDYLGILSAVFSNMTRSGRPVGASTITQQVAKNLLLTNEVSYVRKLKEAILARRIEQALTKQQILELYLNQIFLGRNSYGVQAASRAYFNKDVGELALHEFAYLAILPKAPSAYTPERHMEKALGRRNWVLGEMLKNGFISQSDHAAAVAMPLGTTGRSVAAFNDIGGYFVEEVRRDLISRFGENQEDGPYSLYSGGLWVRTSLDPRLQEYAEQALRDGLVRYDRGKGWSGPVKTMKAGDGWEQRMRDANIRVGYPDWRAAIVLAKGPTTAQIGFADGKTGVLPSWGATLVQRKTGQSAFNAMKPGDVIAVKAESGVYTLRNVPEVSGGMVVQDPHTGRVLAMQGGFDSRIATYNRATQAERQPGSSFKPFVYASALDQGMTPASIIVDGSFCVYQSAKLGRKCFKNFGGGAGAGPQTMRWGLEQSRNLMTVRAASQTGMDNVVKVAASTGISKPGRDYLPVLAIALGAGETTVMDMVNAYSILVSNGLERRPTIVDFVQDRTGKVRYRADTRPCEGCNAPDWNGSPMPRPPARTKQLMNAMSAFQVVHMLEGVIQRGTATPLLTLKRPIFGKTGTTTGPTNVWFVGGSADMIAGVYVGFDQPRPMGSYAQGGTMAVPIFKQFATKAMEGMPVKPFRAPAGVRMVRIDRSSGRRVFGAWPSSDPKASVIWEAFKPESEPMRSIRRDEIAKPKVRKKASSGAGNNAARRSGGSNGSSGGGQSGGDFLQREGGIY
jgi:penicillin-binding protein 1A